MMSNISLLSNIISNSTLYYGFILQFNRIFTSSLNFLAVDPSGGLCGLLGPIFWEPILGDVLYSHSKCSVNICGITSVVGRENSFKK